MFNSQSGISSPEKISKKSSEKILSKLNCSSESSQDRSEDQNSHCRKIADAIDEINTKALEQNLFLTESFTKFLVDVKNTPGIIWFGLFILFFILAYFLGLTFFRRNPKDVDVESFKYIKNKFFTQYFKKHKNSKSQKFLEIKIIKAIREFLFEDEKPLNDDLINNIAMRIINIIIHENDTSDQGKLVYIIKRDFYSKNSKKVDSGNNSEQGWERVLEREVKRDKAKLNKDLVNEIRKKIIATYKEKENGTWVKEIYDRIEESKSDEERPDENEESSNISPDQKKLFEIYDIIELAIIEELKVLLRSNFGSEYEDEVEYPYLYLPDYLKKRGLDYLLVFINWKDNEDFRSKTYINILKMRIMFHQPEKMGNIIRNEAHIRLASSAWYVANILIILSQLGFLFFIFGFFVYINPLSFEDFKSIDTLIGTLEQALPHLISFKPWVYLNVFIGPGLVFFISKYSIRSIKKFFLYQRLREIVYVLETAYTAFVNTPNFPGKPFSKN